MTILYIGNSTETFEQYAKEKDVTLMAVGNSIEGMQLLKSSNDIDIIISDFNLPGNTGLFLFDLIKSEPVLSNIPFILVSNEYSNKLFKEAFSKGISDYFVSSTTETSQIIERAKSLHKFQSFKIDDLDKSENHETYKLPISKRIFDIVFASSVLVCIAPFMLLIMLAIRMVTYAVVTRFI